MSLPVRFDPDDNIPRAFHPGRLFKIFSDIENFYGDRQKNFAVYENWYFKQHGDTDPNEEPLTPINLPTHMVNMAVSMATQEDPIIEVLSNDDKAKSRKAGNTAEKVFQGVIQANSTQQGRDLIHDYFFNLFQLGWGVTYTVWDDARMPDSMRSDMRKLVAKEVRSELFGEQPSSPDALDFDDEPVDADDGLMPIVVECPHPSQIFPLPGGHRERWKGVFRRLSMRLADAEDYYGIEFPRKPDGEDMDPLEAGGFDDTEVTTYDFWYYIGNHIWHTIVATGIPQWVANTNPRINKKLVLSDMTGLAYIKQPCKMPEYSRLPYEITFCFPTTSKDGARFGLSLLYTVIDSIAAAERLASKMEMVIDTYADPVMITEFNSEMGDAVAPAITKMPGEVVQVDVGKGQAVRYLQWQGSPPDGERLRDFWLTMSREMGFDTNIEGTTGLDTIVKKSGILAKTSVCIRQAEKGLAATHARIIQLFVKMVSKSLTVRGERTVDDSSEAYSLDIKGSELKGMDKAMVKIRARFPYEELQNASAAQAVSGGDRPLLSMSRTRTKYLNIQDPDAEQRRIDEELLNTHPMWNDAVIQAAVQILMTPPAPPPIEAAPGVPDMAGDAMATTIGQMSNINPAGMNPSPAPLNATGNAPGAGVPNGSVEQTLGQLSAGRPPV